jgi:phosphatidylinositol glycan class B
MSSATSEVSRLSSTIDDETKDPKKQSRAGQAVKHVVQSANAQDVLLFLVAFRVLNALTIQTFFQPDEYFQSLEPAWRLAFGDNSGAWITWVSAGAYPMKSS